MEELELKSFELVQENTKEEKKWCVYCHTNKINGKKYIGITSKNPPNLRWENGYGYRRNPHFWNAIELYGWDGFTHEILIDNLTEKESQEKEIELIKFYKSNQRDYGYNIETGGVGHPLSQETREKLSRSHAGLHAGEKNNFYGVHMNGEENPFFGHKHSEESKRKMSEARSGHKGHQCKPVYSPELNRIFWGAKAVENEFGVSRSRISAKCKGKDPYHIGLLIDNKRVLTTWLYAKDAIEQNYITQQQLDDYLNELKGV